uniref:Putative RagB-SusD domain-containing protein n=1 Tax=termite gut metagenome TaxID=433724 RepID=S0DFQ1_9ZZZZ
MKTKYIIAFLACSLALGACTDMLDVPQKSVVDMDNFYKTDEDATEAVVYLYNGFSSVAGNAAFFKILSDGDSWSGGGSRNDNSSYEELNEFTFTTQNSNISGYFSALYTLIYRANLIIENFGPDSDIKKQAIAEARFFRAYAYFDLVTFWGTPPLITRTAKSEADYKQPNGDPDEIWTLIETDLTEALDLNILPEKTGLDDTATGVRVTKQTAQAILGKAYVFQKKWGDAATVLDKVIESGLYDLFEGDYGDILRSKNDFNRESMLEANKVGDPANPFNVFSMYNLMIGWRNEYMSDDFFWLTMEYGFLQGWGFMNPTEELYNRFVAWEGADGYRLNSVMKTYDQVKALGVSVKTGSSLYGHEGYFLWKQRLTASEAVPGGWACYDTNTRMLRFAEVLFLAAEAHLQDGNAGKALDYVNRVRSRAQLANLGSLTMDDLKIEKRLELCFEGVRYQDLIRWGDAATALRDRGKYVPTFDGTSINKTLYTNSNAGFVTGKHELMPFPFTETSVNDKIVQNPGWN